MIHPNPAFHNRLPADGEFAAAPSASSLLRAAACRLLSGGKADGLPFTETPTPEELSLLIRGVGGNARPAGLLRALRAEAIREWSECALRPDPSELLRMLDTFEQAEAMLDRGAGPPLPVSHDPKGLNLVVEVAHDLRSPLTSILFLAETLRRGHSGAVNDVQHRQLGIIYSAALGLISVVSDMIEFSQGTDRLLEKEPAPVSIRGILNSVRDIVQPLAEEKGLAIRLLSPAIDQRLGYSVALSRLLLNLTTNALKFTDDGFVEIVARATGPDRVEFSVRDTGNGIDPAVLANLYEPFRSTREANGRCFSGSGLGLKISRELAHAMGSELHLETGVDWGTRFFFELELPPANVV